ncbi:hypothetical protein [Paraburkholderia sp. SIMBA_030]|uniref:hypothetical protein n=1 Tax=Paraburkholderia sp. SIMBA_030 TaxID=3085773 RepID=UPI003979190D
MLAKCASGAAITVPVSRHAVHIGFIANIGLKYSSLYAVKSVCELSKMGEYHGDFDKPADSSSTDCNVLSNIVAYPRAA